MVTVIVFGPTGNVASVAAQTAQQAGAKVWLAMRDPRKPIPGLSAAQETAGGFARVQADLTQPATVAAAVKTSGAKHAFLYLAFGSTDHMKATAEALKASGVELVVFLSSFTVGNADLRGPLDPRELLGFVHAGVEQSLDEVYGPDNYVAVRPGGFATNILHFKRGIADGRVGMFGAGYRLDFIAPVDMGVASGTILARGLPADGQRKVFLYGPQLLRQDEAVRVVGEVLGKEVAVSAATPEQALQDYLDSGSAKPVAEYMMEVFGRMENDTTGELEAAWRVRYEEGVENVKKYTGRPGTGFREWVEANRELFK